MLSRIFNRFATPRALSQARGYMNKAAYEAQVPDHIKKALEKNAPPTQDVGSGTCRIEANATRSSLQSELSQFGVPQKPPTKSTPRWTDDNAKRVKDGYPAVVDGEGSATKHSEWHNGDHHAVTVLSPTKDGKKFVVHDPDRTHDPQALKAHQEGRAEPRHNLRTMTQEELEKVRPRVIEGGMFESPTVEPVVEQGYPSRGWFSGFFGRR